MWTFDVLEACAILPGTVAQTPDGVYRLLGPLKVVEVGHQDVFQNELSRLVTQGNPVIPAHARDGRLRDSEFAKIARVKTYREYMSRADAWKLYQDAGSCMRLQGMRRLPGGGWGDDANNDEVVPSSNTIEWVCQRIERYCRGRS